MSRDDLELLKRFVEFVATKIRCVSVNEISENFGIDRGVVLSMLEKLEKQGFPLDVCDGGNYRFRDLDNLVSAQKYVEYLDTKLRYRVRYVEVCGSTQDIAIEMARLGAPEGTVVIAEELERGRGRMGRRWIASRGGLWFSLILRPPKMKYINLLSLTTAVGVAQAIKNLLDIDAKIKWPNDVLVDEKKVSGILIEGALSGEGTQYLVVGIGVNVNNELPQELRESAISLRNVVGFDIPRVPLLLSILKNLDKVYSYIYSEKVEEVLGIWKSMCVTLGRKVKVIAIEDVFEGVAEDIEIDGALRVRLGDGSVKKFYTGDVIHIR